MSKKTEADSRCTENKEQKNNAVCVENSDNTEVGSNAENIDFSQGNNIILEREKTQFIDDNKEITEIESIAAVDSGYKQSKTKTIKSGTKTPAAPLIIKTYQEQYKGQAFPCPYCGIKTERKLEEDNTHYICEVCGQKFFDASQKWIKENLDKEDVDEYLATDKKIEEWQNKHKLKIRETGEVQYEANDGLLILQKENIGEIEPGICSQINTLIVPCGIRGLKNEFWQQMTSLEKIGFQSNDEGEFTYKKSTIKHNNISIKIYGKTKSGEEIAIENYSADKKTQNGLAVKVKELFIKIREFFKSRNNKSEGDKSNSEPIEENFADKTIKLDQDSVDKITERLYNILRPEIEEINNNIEDVEVSTKKTTKEMSEKLIAIEELIRQNKQLSDQLEYYEKLFAKAVLGEDFDKQQYDDLQKELNCAMYGFGALRDIKKIYSEIKKRQEGKLSIDYEIKQLNKVLEEYERMIGENLK